MLSRESAAAGRAGRQPSRRASSPSPARCSPSPARSSRPARAPRASWPSGSPTSCRYAEHPRSTCRRWTRCTVGWAPSPAPIWWSRSRRPVRSERAHQPRRAAWSTRRRRRRPHREPRLTVRAAAAGRWPPCRRRPPDADPGDMIAMASTLAVGAWSDAVAVVTMSMRGPHRRRRHRQPPGRWRRRPRTPSRATNRHRWCAAHDDFRGDGRRLVDAVVQGRDPRPDHGPAARLGLGAAPARLPAVQ